MQPATNAWRLARAGVFRRGVSSGVRSENSRLATVTQTGSRLHPSKQLRSETHEQNQPGVDSSLAGGWIEVAYNVHPPARSWSVCARSACSPKVQAVRLSSCELSCGAGGGRRRG